MSNINSLKTSNSRIATINSTKPTLTNPLLTNDSQRRVCYTLSSEQKHDYEVINEHKDSEDESLFLLTLQSNNVILKSEAMHKASASVNSKPKKLSLFYSVNPKFRLSSLLDRIESSNVKLGISDPKPSISQNKQCDSRLTICDNSISYDMLCKNLDDGKCHQSPRKIKPKKQKNYFEKRSNELVQKKMIIQFTPVTRVLASEYEARRQHIEMEKEIESSRQSYFNGIKNGVINLDLLKGVKGGTISYAGLNKNRWKLKNNKFPEKEYLFDSSIKHKEENSLFAKASKNFGEKQLPLPRMNLKSPFSNIYANQLDKSTIQRMLRISSMKDGSQADQCSGRGGVHDIHPSLIKLFPNIKLDILNKY